MPSASSPATAGSASGSTANGAADTVIIKNFMFSPATLTVAPGATVTVRNEDTVACAVSSAPEVSRPR